MKKTFKLTHPKHKTARVVEAVKHDIKKYLKRERNKKRPNDVDFWDFDCKFGLTEKDAVDVHVADFSKLLSDAESKSAESVYIEILVKDGIRVAPPEPTQLESDLADADDLSDGADEWKD